MSQKATSQGGCRQNQCSAELFSVSTLLSTPRRCQGIYVRFGLFQWCRKWLGQADSFASQHVMFRVKPFSMPQGSIAETDSAVTSLPSLPLLSHSCLLCATFPRLEFKMLSMLPRLFFFIASRMRMSAAAVLTSRWKPSLLGMFLPVHCHPAVSCLQFARTHTDFVIVIALHQGGVRSNEFLRHPLALGRSFSPQQRLWASQIRNFVQTVCFGAGQEFWPFPPMCPSQPCSPRRVRSIMPSMPTLPSGQPGVFKTC